MIVGDLHSGDSYRLTVLSVLSLWWWWCPCIIDDVIVTVAVPSVVCFVWVCHLRFPPPIQVYLTVLCTVMSLADTNGFSIDDPFGHVCACDIEAAADHISLSLSIWGAGAAHTSVCMLVLAIFLRVDGVFLAPILLHFGFGLKNILCTSQFICFLPAAAVLISEVCCVLNIKYIELHHRYVLYYSNTWYNVVYEISVLWFCK